MRALVLRAPRQFAVEDVPVPTALDPDDVLCQVHTTFICGTDPHIINGDYPGFWPPSFPFIPGHEWSAEVVEAGTRAKSLGWKAGDRVCAISHCGCGVCRNCLRGRYNLCLNYGQPEAGHRQYGHITPGAYADYVKASVKSLVRVPDGFDLGAVGVRRSAEHRALHRQAQPAAAGRRSAGDGHRPAGADGDPGRQGARRRPHPRRRLGRAARARREARRDSRSTIAQGKVVERIREMTDGLGVPAVLECAGTAQSIRDCCLAAAKGGVVSVIGIPQDEPQLPMKRIVLDEIEIVGDRANPNTAEAALALLVNGRVDLDAAAHAPLPAGRVRDRARDLRDAQGRRSESRDHAAVTL